MICVRHRRLLRAGRKRPRSRRAAEQRDELAAATAGSACRRAAGKSLGQTDLDEPRRASGRPEA